MQNIRLTETVRIELERLVNAGDICIDATAGNGYDTLTMAKCVGSTGKVFAIDIQAAAIEATQTRIKEADLQNRCGYHLGDHAKILPSLSANYAGRVRAITFNLGYLPGNDKTQITTPESTITALKNTILLLSSNGALFVIAYRGHAGGLAEAEVVEETLQELPADEWALEKHEPTLRDPQRIPPILWIARR